MRFAGLTLLLTLFAAPVFAQAPPAEKKSDPNNPKDSYEGVYRNFLLAAQQPPAADADKLRAELKKLEAELEKTLAETQKIKAQIEQVRARMKSAEQTKEGQPDALHLWLDTGDAKQGPQEIILRKVDGAWKIVEGKKEPVPGTPVFPKAGTPVPPGTIVGPGGGGPALPPGYAPARPDADQRIDKLEKKLDKLMELLEQMRKEMDGSRKRTGADAEAEQRAKAVDALNRIAEDKKNADLRELKRAEEAAKEKAEEAERKALRDQQKAVQEELKRVEELQRALEEARKKKADDNKKEKPRQE